MSKPAFIEVSAGVRYWEDATINGADDEDGTLTPFRKEDNWCPVIRLDDGVVMDWPAGMEASIHFKVCDDGDYWLLDADRDRIAKWGGYYVPDDFLCPGENGFGDYIILKIDGAGRIAKWREPAIVWARREGDQQGWARIAAKPVEGNAP